MTVGRTSTVLGAALLTEGLRGTGIPDKVALTALGDRTLASVLRSLPPSIAGEDSLRYRGIAHGWAGLLYTSLRWCQATQARIPGQVLGLLDELAGLETIRHGHSSWAGPHDPGPDGGWCHGTAGYTHLWALAAAVVDEEKYAPLAACAAAATWATPARAAHLCCSLTGQAYAMLMAYQLSGEAHWLRHAADLAARASAYATTRNSLPNSLWKGDVGVACLAVDLESPAHASVPLFGHECWPAEAPRGELRELPV